MNVNPVLSEIQGLSPAAQQALGMAGHTLPPDLPAPVAPNVTPAPMHSTAIAGEHAPILTPQVKANALVHPDDGAGPAPMLSPMHMADAPAPILSAPSEPNVSGPIRGTLQGDQLERHRLLDTGSGESQIASKIEGTGFGQAHPLLGKILGGAAQGAATLGDIGLSAVAPQVAINLPGTAYHHEMLLHGADKQVASDEANAKDEAQTANLGATTAKTQEETEGLPQEQSDKHDVSQATAGNLNSEVEEHNAQASALLHPQAKTDFEAWQKQNPNKPIEEWLKSKANAAAPKVTPEQSAYDQAFKELTGKGMSPSQAVEKLKEKPPSVNVNSGEAALDREAKQFGAPHSKSLDAANSQLEKIQDARSMINGNAESQALGIPKVLTALVGGQGTGVRITQPELTAIAKARGLTGDIEGTLNSWAGKGKLTSTQQQQLTAIMDDVKQRLMEKQGIAKDALDTINGAPDRNTIVQADKDARQKLSDFEQHGHYAGQTVKLKNGQSVVLKAVHPNGDLEY